MKKIKLLLILVVGLFTLSTVSAQVSVGVSITASIPPPPLLVYTQPPCPTDGFLWSPGYWAYSDDGYFWVPGVWVRPPQYGYLWTPPYWGFAGGVYGFHHGYWGPHVGFYGGINYGYGYGGSGFWGGRWEGNSFRYNTAVVNVNTTVIHNTYVDRTVIVNNSSARNNHVSFNGGSGGVNARPTPQEQSAQRENHIQATAEQTSHLQQARTNRAQFASVNHGRPSTVAMSQPGGHAYDAKGSQLNQPAAIHTSPAHASSQASITHPSPVHKPANTQGQSHANNPSAQPHYAQQSSHNNPASQPHYAHQPQHNNPTPQPHYTQQQPQNHPAPQPHYTQQQPQNHPAPQPHYAQQPHNTMPQHSPAPQQHNNDHQNPGKPKEH